MIGLDPNYALAFNGRGEAYRSTREYDKAIKDYGEAIRVNPNYDLAFNNLAWVLATCPKDGVRDGKRAVQAATKACELTGWKVAGYLDTLAAAHAEAGDFNAAVKYEKKVMELGIEDKDTEREVLERLKPYEEGKPYRDQ